MVTSIWAAQALVGGQWHDGVRVLIGASGLIAAVQTGIREAEADQPGTRNSVRVGCLLPAPCNVHSHAFQRAMAGLTESRGVDPTDSFWTWRQRMYRFLDHLDPEHVQAISAFAQMEMLESGFAAVGEFHYLHHQADGTPYTNIAELSERIAAAADESGIGLTLLPVLYQQGGCDGRPLVGGQRRFGNESDQFLNLFEAAQRALKNVPADAEIGVAPHSLRAVSPDALRALLQHSVSGPVHIHVSEQTAEIDEVRAALGARPVAWLLANAPVDPQWCLIHATHLDDTELRGLVESGAVAGLCPITESSLGDGTFRCVEFRDAGGVFAVGSDSNVRISLSEELRTLEYSQRLRDRGRAMLASTSKSTGRVLFETALEGGARACARASGDIAAGALADLVALDCSAVDLVGRSGDSLLDSFVFARGEDMVGDVWSAGRHVVHDGRHWRREEITSRYKAVMRELLAIT